MLRILLTCPARLLSIQLLLFIAMGCNQVHKMEQEADASRKTSDSILKKFKSVDEDLKASDQKLDSIPNNLKDSLISSF